MSSVEAGAMLEPLAVAFHAVRRSGYVPGQTILISGAGPVGLLSLLTTRTKLKGPIDWPAYFEGYQVS